MPFGLSQWAYHNRLLQCLPIGIPPKSEQSYRVGVCTAYCPMAQPSLVDQLKAIREQHGGNRPYVVPSSVNAGDVFDIVVPATEAPASEEERAWCQWVVADACPNGWCLLKPLDIYPMLANIGSQSEFSIEAIDDRDEVEVMSARLDSSVEVWIWEGLLRNPKFASLVRKLKPESIARIATCVLRELPPNQVYDDPDLDPELRDHYQALSREAQRIEDYEVAHATELLPAAQAAAMIDLARKRITAEA